MRAVFFASVFAVLMGKAASQTKIVRSLIADFQTVRRFDRDKDERWTRRTGRCFARQRM